MKKVILLFALFLLFLPLVASEDPRFIGERDSDLDIKEPCYYNGTYCSGSAACNITIWRPNNAGMLVSNRQMTNRGSYHNYTLNATQTADIGEYEVSIMCCDDLCGYDTFFFRITPSGHLYQQGEATIYSILLIVMFGAAVFFLFIFSKIETPGIKLFFLLLSIVSMLLTAGAGRVLLNYTSLSGGIIDIATAFMIILGLTFLIIMYYVFVNQTRRALQLMRIRKGWGDVENVKDF